jgi:hypothetical protein
VDEQLDAAISEDASVDASDDASAPDDDAGTDASTPDDAGPDASTPCEAIGVELEWNDVDEDCDGALGRRWQLEHEIDTYAALDWMRLREGILYSASPRLRARSTTALDEPLFEGSQLEHGGPGPSGYDVRNGVLAIERYDFGGGSPAGLVIFEWSDPTVAPIERSLIELPPTFTRFVLAPDGGSLYTVALDLQERAVLTVWDLADLDEPVERGSMLLSYVGTSGFFARLIENGGTLYVLQHSQLLGDAYTVVDICDVSDPDAPTARSETIRTDELDIVSATAGGLVTAYPGGGGDLYLTAWETHTRQGPLNEPNSSSQYAFNPVADDRGVFYVRAVDRTNPYRTEADALCFVDSTTLERSCVPLDSSLGLGTSAIMLDGDDLVLGNAWQRVAFDVGTPSSPTRRAASWPGSAYVTDLAVDEAQGHLYVSGNAGFAVYDVAGLDRSDQPIGALVIHQPGEAEAHVQIHGGYALVATGGRLLSIDLSNPREPEIWVSVPLGFYNTFDLALVQRGTSTFAVAVGRTNGGGKLTIIDVTNPIFPDVPVTYELAAPMSNIGSATLVSDAGYLYLRYWGPSAQGAAAFAWGSGPLTLSHVWPVTAGLVQSIVGDEGVLTWSAEGQLLQHAASSGELLGTSTMESPLYGGHVVRAAGETFSIGDAATLGVHEPLLERVRPIASPLSTSYTVYSALGTAEHLYMLTNGNAYLLRSVDD